ncbi:MAG TPA: SEC-C metal-binding domain-containing protein [Polyangiaceae bacterium]
MSLLELRVSPLEGADVYRTLELSGAHSLHDLHLAIQSAFELDDDHLYAFFMNGNPWDTEFGYWSAPDSAGEKSSEATLDDLALCPNKRFLYLFDYGDEHLFAVRVVRVDAGERGPSRPRLADSAGDAPVQYPDLDAPEEPACAHHAPPDPTLADLARRLGPVVQLWSDENPEDEDEDDSDVDSPADALTTASSDAALAPRPSLRQEYDLALELLERCNNDASHIHEHIEHALDADVLGWLIALPNRLADEEGALPLAITLTERLLVMMPEPPLRAALGNYLAVDGQTAEARALLETLLREEPEDPFVAYRVASILLELGDLPRAEQCYRDALRFAGSERQLRERAREELVALLEDQGRSEDAAAVTRAEKSRAARATRRSASLLSPSQPITVEAKPGRNDPCTCGSGKKFKKCCGMN